MVAGEQFSTGLKSYWRGKIWAVLDAKEGMKVFLR